VVPPSWWQRAIVGGAFEVASFGPDFFHLPPLAIEDKEMERLKYKLRE